MASIMTSIDFQERFNSVVYEMIYAAELNTTAIYNMREAVGMDIDTGALEGARQLDAI